MTTVTRLYLKSAGRCFPGERAELDSLEAWAQETGVSRCCPPVGAARPRVLNVSLFRKMRLGLALPLSELPPF